MRTAEDRPLLEDAALPGARLVLSPLDLEAWLAESIGRPCVVRLRRLRYKPATSVTVGFDLTTERDGVRVTEACVANAYAAHTAVKIAKTLERLPASECLAHDPRSHALVTTAAGDRALPLLPRLARPGGLAEVLQRLLPAPVAVDGARLRTIRHNPGRRWVGALERDHEATLLLRAYQGRGRMGRAAEGYSALTRKDRVRTPRLVATSRSLALVAVTWVEGEDLSSSLRSEAWGSAGHALATLHASRRVRLPSPEPAAESTAVRRATRQIAHLRRGRSTEVLALGRAVARLLDESPVDHTALHGDFSADQVVIDHAGDAVLIDLDSARWGPAAADLGCLEASTHTQADEAGTHFGADRRIAALMAGYAEVRRPPDPFAVAVHAVAYRLRKSIDPFRSCRPDWREQVDRRLDGVQQALADLARDGGP